MLNSSETLIRPAPLPDNERERLDKLHRYRVLDTPPEETFDRITRIIAETIGVPIALVSLVDSERQWFKSKYGITADETPRDIAFCAHAIVNDDVFVVQDASKDPRFAENPLVLEDPSIRFYAGAPLRTPDGLNLGTLCAIDREPRKLTEKQSQLLSDLSSIVVDELELRVALRNAMKEAAEEVQLREIKDQFISQITHELRTPLTSIKGALGLLGGGVIKNIPRKAVNIIEIANRNVDNLLNLINDLLDFQKLQSGKMNFDFNFIDVDSLTQEVCENMQEFSREKGVRIRLDIGAEGTIFADRMRLSQALTNLISNAIKFSPDGGEIVVKTEFNEAELRFSVSDTGPGIPESFRDKIFEKFSQASARHSQNGTGLGLSICKEIVDAHRGKLGFETEMNCGTTFYIDLPKRPSVI